MSDPAKSASDRLKRARANARRWIVDEFAPRAVGTVIALAVLGRILFAEGEGSVALRSLCSEGLRLLATLLGFTMTAFIFAVGVIQRGSDEGVPSLSFSKRLVRTFQWAMAAEGIGIILCLGHGLERLVGTTLAIWVVALMLGMVTCWVLMLGIVITELARIALFHIHEDAGAVQISESNSFNETEREKRPG